MELPSTDCTDGPWNSYIQASIRFCEDRLCGFIVEPANTWSNIGYFIAGLLIIRSNWGRGRPTLNIIGITALLVGVGSTLFHATGTRWGELLDVSAMYLISALFITFALCRVMTLTRMSTIMFYFGLSLLSIIYLVLSKSSGIMLFASQITIMVLLEIRAYFKASQKADYKYLGLVAGAFAVAYTAWLLDYHRVICDPHNHILGGHAIWHLTNATCLWSYYKFQEQFD